MNTDTENETAPTLPVAAEATPAPTTPPPTTEAEDEDDDESGEAGSNGEEAGDGRPAKRKRPRWSDLNRAHREALDAQAEARELRQRLDELQRGEKPGATPKPQTPAPKRERPTLESCDFDQDRLVAETVAFEIEERERTKTEAAEKSKAEQTTQERIVALQSKEAEFAKAHPDYEGVAKSPHVPITQAMAAVMLENPDTAPAIAYYLGSHIDEAREIAAMNPLAQARALGVIEAKVSTPTQAQQTPPPAKPVAKAPTVPPTLQPGASGTKDWNQMSTEEHVKAFQDKQKQGSR